MSFRCNFRSVAPLALAAVSLFFAPQAQAATGMTVFKQALAEEAASDRDIAAFYRDNRFAPLWTGASAEDRARRKALITALSSADLHGLPEAQYRVDDLMSQMRSVNGSAERAALEVALTKAFLDYARDMQTGVLEPSKVVPGIVREIPLRDRAETLAGLKAGAPDAYMRSLMPQTPEYSRLMKARMGLERIVAQGGWGPVVRARSLKPGASGADVVTLRNRLIAMGYMPRAASVTYDDALTSAVLAFQIRHGLEADGVAGPSTISAINVSAQKRMQSVMVAMERERWLNLPRGERHILVNITDFSARVMDDHKETFRTRAVVGKNTSDRQTPEFSDEMDHMVINPSWNVPRSITTKEYLPKMQSNPNAHSYLAVIDSRGRTVPRSAVNFASFNAKTFPYRLKQPPSGRNALGLVKFMFPNKHNIYLHDTPHKNLFGREVRAYSHGCVRLAQPFDFAYTLLAKQEADPVGFFQSTLKTRRETRVNLETVVPVHITYRTAFTDAKGAVHYRADVYGRDAALFQALLRAGVSLPDVQG